MARATTPAYRQARLKPRCSSSKTKTKAKEELFVLKMEQKKPDPEEDQPANRLQKSTFKPVESDQFQIGPRIQNEIPFAHHRFWNGFCNTFAVKKR